MFLDQGRGARDAVPLAFAWTSRHLQMYWCDVCRDRACHRSAPLPYAIQSSRKHFTSGGSRCALPRCLHKTYGLVPRDGLPGVPGSSTVEHQACSRPRRFSGATRVCTVCTKLGTHMRTPGDSSAHGARWMDGRAGQMKSGRLTTRHPTSARTLHPGEQ